jgi:glycine cleavage system H protein
MFLYPADEKSIPRRSTMSVPTDLKYTKTDEWIKVEGNQAAIGITDYAQDQLSDVVFVEMTVEVGDDVKKNATCVTIESVKAAADVSMPVDGKVVAINESLPDAPEVVNSDPYGKAWMLKIEVANPAQLNELMDAAAYDAYCQERGH